MHRLAVCWRTVVAAADDESAVPREINGRHWIRVRWQRLRHRRTDGAVSPPCADVEICAPERPRVSAPGRPRCTVVESSCRGTRLRESV